MTEFSIDGSEHIPDIDLVYLGYALGVALVHLGRIPDAIVAFQFGLNSHKLVHPPAEEISNEAPDTPVTLVVKSFDVYPCLIHELAKALQENGNTSDALEMFNILAVCQPANASVFFRRGFCHRTLGDNKAAVCDFVQARTLDPDNPKFVLDLCILGKTRFVAANISGMELLT